MCQQLTPWEECIAFHGHVCPGLIIGYKMAEIALRELGVSRAQDEELVAIVENDACGIDAVQVMTGCTMGKGNLIYRDLGKQVYTIGNRKTEEAVRIAVKPGIMEPDPEYRCLMDKLEQGGETSEEYDAIQHKHQEKVHYILHLPDDQFCKVEKVQLAFPEKARIFASIVCAECGEGTMEPRVRVKNGKMVCLECAGADYTRGW
ncbi:FmdE family protein [Candidatus Formimonas warabiya]|uniref:Formylmethanofuran dehydrogenase n=1 Tax=Formimonas warabiya TaxID=1761012 RepID=A0A3G1KYR3_FORW1|nr:FmdE family protein [Candidatus Formimonas warabiya]ATW27636.1 formylmethanofuran dehydrogenase [Candidatus Formimonas warabiya]